MSIIVQSIIVLIILLHMYFMVLEMLFWDHPFGRKVFGMSEQESAITAILAKNQGLYNGFLAAGVAWGWWAQREDVLVFFLVCIVLAGILGAITANRSIIYIQALPAAIALLLLQL